MERLGLSSNEVPTKYWSLRGKRSCWVHSCAQQQIAAYSGLLGPSEGKGAARDICGESVPKNLNSDPLSLCHQCLLCACTCDASSRQAATSTKVLHARTSEEETSNPQQRHQRSKTYVTFPVLRAFPATAANPPLLLGALTPQSSLLSSRSVAQPRWYTNFSHRTRSASEIAVERGDFYDLEYLGIPSDKAEEEQVRGLSFRATLLCLPTGHSPRVYH